MRCVDRPSLQRTSCGNPGPTPVTTLISRACGAQPLIRRRAQTHRAFSLMPAQNLGEAPNLVKRVVKGCRCGPDHVWLAEIAFDAGGFQFVEQFLRMIMGQDGELATASLGFFGCDYGEP